MDTPSTLADACPECFPGDVPAALPVGDPEPVPGNPGSVKAAYRCVNGHTWVCWWDARSAGWPAAREAA